VGAIVSIIRSKTWKVYEVIRKWLYRRRHWGGKIIIRLTPPADSNDYQDRSGTVVYIVAVIVAFLGKETDVSTLIMA
jgi:hypothetical protein